jgi:hypothetical protein
MWDNTRWFKYYRDDFCVNKSQFVPVIFEPPCTIDALQNLFWTDTEQADDNHNKQQDQASPQWLWYNILTFLRDDIDHNIL